ncbi:MAG: hypothetical protein QOG53_1394 [Frankiales bacterium]|jgi:hypothetical protein|nr:hypothetical protein [Frankiales bacterium]
MLTGILLLTLTAALALTFRLVAVTRQAEVRQAEIDAELRAFEWRLQRLTRAAFEQLCDETRRRSG